LLAAPLSFAVANSQAAQSVFARVQQTFSNNQIAAPVEQAPMTLEEGVAVLTSSSNLTVVEASAGANHSVAILSDGTLWAWGQGTNGQLGLNSTADVLLPTQVGTDTTWDSISVGSFHALATRTDGTLWAWGQGTSGQLGLNSTANVLVPTQVPTPATAAAGTTWDSISAGGLHSLATRSDSTLWSWGQGEHGRLGLDDETNRLVPTQILTPATAAAGTTWDSISAGVEHSLAIRTDGTLWAWGAGGQRQTGLNSTDDALLPTQVGTDTTWNSISAGSLHSLATRTDGTLWSWGWGTVGQLGLGSTVTTWVPTQVPTPDTAAPGTTWDSISAGVNHSIAIRSDGTLWIWGMGGSGRLGLDSAANVFAPTQLQPGTTWDSISGGGQHTLAIRADDTLWSWGMGVSGQLGINDTDNRLVPTLVNPEVIANVPAHSSTVAMTTDTLSITFNRPLDPGITYNFPIATGGSIILDQGASVDMAAGTWNTERTVFTVPLTLVTPGALHTVNVINFGFPNIPHTWTFSTEGPTTTYPMADTLTKILHLPEGADVPDLRFDFTFTPTQVVLITEPPQASSVAVASVPSITTQSISFTSATSYEDVAGIRIATENLNLRDIVEGLTFPHAGTFVWNIEEVQATVPPVTSPSSMAFSQARYEMRVVVDRDFEVLSIALYVRTLDTQDQTIDAKVDAAVFTNTYSTVVNTSLYVRKTTEGRLADPDLNFDFTLTLTESTSGGTIGTVTANVVAVGDVSNTPIRTVSITAGANTFSLSHNERLLIPDLPVGTTFVVSEAAATEYTAGAVITIGGTPQAPAYQNANRGTALTTGSYTLATGTNSAHFTNVHHHVPDTGLFLNNTALIPVVLGILALAMLAISRRRKRIEELPVV